MNWLWRWVGTITCAGSCVVRSNWAHERLGAIPTFDHQVLDSYTKTPASFSMHVAQDLARRHKTQTNPPPAARRSSPWPYHHLFLAESSQKKEPQRPVWKVCYRLIQWRLFKTIIMLATV